MSSNILVAIHNIVSFGTNDLEEYKSRYQVRINNSGEQLEYYVKDALAGSLTVKGQDAKDLQHFAVLSYSGNQNNPPDAVLKNGDAIEIKKIESPRSILALSNSPPKKMLYSNDTRILASCRRCDGGQWDTKDLFYLVGYLSKSPKKIRYLYFVHAFCYAAEKIVYERLQSRLKSGIDQVIATEGLEAVPTTELGRIGRVDPLGITQFRMRGMWEIQNPINVFQYLYQWDECIPFTVVAIISKTKYDSYPSNDRHQLELDKRIQVQDCQVKNPDNPAQKIPAKLVVYQMQ